ncbi:uncharacterized protein CEXT_802331 [Caerostris extrusa]|uniref:Uncharacterized protein n=1 Tax=Caerostris extrusa TaxID=172846 RepID=A0AAV4PEJ1_CAEEX|nr:uncharacterized protein CEXT_802331 [Caerostris extrusa]
MLELETEAHQRVKQMEKRLKSSAKTTMETVINVHECEKEMRRLVEERLYAESVYEDVAQHLCTSKEENNFLRDQNCNLSHDVQALLHIIHHARSTGHWEMNCVTFCEVTPEQVFGPVQSISNVNVPELPQSDFEAIDVGNKVSSFDNSSQEATDSSTSSPYTVHPMSVHLSDNNSNSHSFSDDSHNELLEKDKKIRFLESQLSELKHQLSMKEAECECHLWKLEMLMQQNRNRVQIFPPDIPSSGTSLPKCISLPDIGNIYGFTSVGRKSHSYCTFNLKPKYNVIDIPETQKCKLNAEKSERVPCIRKGQSEPHLFMIGDNIYVYRPCEPIKKVSNIALHDDYDMSIPQCESIDLRFPTEELRTNVCNWAALSKSRSYGAPQRPHFKDDDSCSSHTCSDPEIEKLNKEMFVQFFGEKVSCSVQTEDKVTYSIGLQAAIKRDGDSDCCSDPGVQSIDRKIIEEFLKIDISTSEKALVEMQENINMILQDKLENGSYKLDVFKLITAVQGLKENLRKAKDKAQAKEILISQLQGHIESAVREVEIKDTALVNLEIKLDMSREEAFTLRRKAYELNLEMEHLIKDVEEAQMLNDNLCLKLDVNEEKMQEILNEQKVLQEQKRALMTQLDAREDELESSKKELDMLKKKTEAYSLHVEQQSQIIRNLQEALVQSKRAFDAVHQKEPLIHETPNESKYSSKNSVMDI